MKHVYIMFITYQKKPYFRPDRLRFGSFQAGDPTLKANGSEIP